MNPFDLRGPEFLLFYATVSVLWIALLRRAENALENGNVPGFGELDPYALACLRGGAAEALRVCIVTLVDRGVLKSDGPRLITVPAFARSGQHPLEQAVLGHFVRGGLASNAFSSDAQEAARAIERQLRELRLLPKAIQWWQRVALSALCVGVLLWLGIAKIEIAFARGRHNVLFLEIGMVIAALAGCYVLLAHRKTWLGVRTLRDFQTLFSGLRDGSTPVHAGGRTPDLAYQAAIFGLLSMPGFALVGAMNLFPEYARRPKGFRQSVTGGGSSCAATCSGSSWSSCSSGGGCGGDGGGGGGGCGGGGGGCGGCGS